MKYRKFGSLDWEVSALGFGAMRLPILDNDSGKIDEPLATTMIRKAIDAGVNYVDTAYPYHDEKSEGFVGRVLKDGYREKVKLATKLPVWYVEEKADFDKYLNEQLEGIEHLQLPKYSKDISYFAYPLICKDINRKKIRTKLESKGIESRPLFGCLPTQQPAFGFLKNIYKGRLPNAEYVGSNGFYIGCHQYLSQDDLDYIVKTLKEVVK